MSKSISIRRGKAFISCPGQNSFSLTDFYFNVSFIIMTKLQFLKCNEGKSKCIYRSQSTVIFISLKTRKSHSLIMLNLMLNMHHNFGFFTRQGASAGNKAAQRRTTKIILPLHEKARDKRF